MQQCCSDEPVEILVLETNFEVASLVFEGQELLLRNSYKIKEMPIRQTVVCRALCGGGNCLRMRVMRWFLGNPSLGS